MSQARPMPEPAEIAGRYQVVLKLGAGAFGTVYKARDTILGRMVAIKTVRLEGLAAAGADLDEMLKRFKQEATTAARLKHPNIVTIYDIGEADGLSYIAMECIEGPGLDKVIAGEGRLPLERAASLSAQVADALGFAHKHGVFHRDIKPANIMVEPGDRVKVTDFGIAKDLSGEQLTMTGSLLGTPSYMSPEQAKGGTIDGRSDLFSVGCVLYEMLGGKKAFRGDSITALIFKIITEEPPHIRELDPNVPDEMVRIITKALTKDANARYQSGEELAKDLHAFLRPGATPTVRQVETPTAPGGASPLASPTVKTAPTVQGLPTLHETSAPAAPTRVAPPPLPRPAAVPPPPRPPAAAVPVRKSGAGAGLLLGLAAAGLLILAIVAGGGWYLFGRKPADTRVADAVTTEPTLAPSSAPLDTLPPAPSAAPPTSLLEATKPPETTSGTTPPARPPKTTADAGLRPRPPTAPLATEPPPQIEDTTPLDGRAAGERIAGTYDNRGAGSRSSGFGASGSLRRRERTPTQLAPGERPAVSTLRLILNAQEAFHSKQGRYGTFAEMASAQVLFLDAPPQGGVVMRPGYRISLELANGGFRALATPTSGGRFFVGDDSGIIRPGSE